MNSLRRAACDILSAERVVALTGAGISTESGIPDFRSRGGLWSRYDINDYGNIDSFQRDPARVWVMLREMISLLDAQPNPAHVALVELEDMGLLEAVITQSSPGGWKPAGYRVPWQFHPPHMYELWATL
jgi:NAD-dependent deacetylase